MLVKRSNRPSGPASSAQADTASTFSAPRGLDRRSFLKSSGLAAGVGAIGAGLPFAMVRPADAASDSKAAGAVEMRRSVCTHCSVGCAIDAEVKNGVWVGQEPVFDSPINLGAHCAKGASVREHGHGEHRLRTPMKLHNGKWERLSWDVALKEVSEKLLAIREKDGPDATYWVGSSKHSNEQAYLLRKFVSFWGTNNCDHQARVCHSTTVAGVANTWGYGAMTNSYNDMQNAKAIFFIGSNAAEAHPVSMLHILHAKEGGAKIIVADPRFTRTAAKADHYVRLRSGSDIALIYGVMRHIFENGWDDKKYIEDRVYGMDKIREESMQWTADKVLDVTGVPDDQVHLIAETMAKNKPSTVVWCMGQTQHSTGNAIVRAMCNLQLALGNVGVSGGGTNIFRGHDNVQGATDVGPNPDSLPGYYGIAAGAWKHWCSVWGVDYEWVKGRYASPGLMEKSGITVSRWIDGVLEKNELIDQDSNLKAVVYWGMAPNSQTRGKDMLEAMKALELLVVVDPYPSATAAMAASVRKEGVYLLPAATQFETSGSCTASNRSLQWREKIIEPLFESKPDHTIMY
nr:molybdopterin-dependent oxidoreductase [Zoogloea sp.]